MRQLGMMAMTALASGCMGGIGGAPDSPAGVASVPSAGPGASTGRPADGTPAVISGGGPSGACGYLPARLYRLTPAQVRRSMVALLGAAAAGDDLERSLQGTVPEGRPFSNAEPVLAASPGFMEAIVGGAREAAAAAAANPATLHPCFSAGVTRACVATFLPEFGTRAWRRDFTPEDTGSYLSFFDAIAAKSDPKRALEYVLRRALAAPEFLFRMELGAAPDRNGVAALTPDEMASALAYVLTDGPPDAALRTAARQRTLETAEGVAVQARRLLERPESAMGLMGFWDDLFDGKQTAHADHPQELRRLVAHVLWKEDARLGTLLTTSSTAINPALQKFYGWTKLPAVTDWTVVTPPPAEGRAGVLTTGVFLSRHPNRSARGKFVRSLFLCTDVPEPPPEVNQNLDGEKAALAARLGRPPTEDETRAEHMTNPACATCHRLVDPIGKPLVAFDRQGLFQTQNPDTRKPWDTAAELVATGEIDGPVKDARGLAQALARARGVSDCVARQTYEYVLGRPSIDADRCAIDALSARLRGSGGDVRQLFVDVVASEAFRLRKVR